jgi:hypothetical protein
MKRNIVFVLILLVLLIECKKPTHENIDIDDKNIAKVQNAMENIIYYLEKSKFDTLAIKNNIKRNRIQDEKSYDNTKNYDSIKEERIEKDFNFDSYKPFSKSIYLNADKSIDLNNRQVSTNILEFSKNIVSANELSTLTSQELKNFISSFQFLINNDISACYKVFENYYEFRYDSGNYKGIDFECYLYLESDYKKLKELNGISKSRVFIEQKHKIILCRGKRT